MGKSGFLKIAGLALLAIGGVYVYKKVKESQRDIEKEEKENIVEENKTGEVSVDEAKPEETITSPEDTCKSDGDTKEGTLEDLYRDERVNLVKELYEHYRFSPDYDEDLINVDRILGTADGAIPEQRIIHVGISEIRGIPHCTFGMEIPTYSDPRALGSYISTLKKVGEEMFKDYTPLSKYPLKNRLRAQFVLEYNLIDDTEDAEPRYSLVDVPRELYEVEPYIEVDEDGRMIHDGLTNYVGYIRSLLNGSDSDVEELKLEDSGENWTNVKIKDVILSYTLSYPIAMEGHNIGGLTVESASKIVDRLTNQGSDIDAERVEIRPRFGKSVEYVGVLFYNSFSEEVEVYEAKEPNSEGKYPVKQIKITY